MFEADSKYKNMSFKEAENVLGDRANWELLKMKKALTSMRAVNSDADEKRLSAVRVYLKSKKTPKTLAELNKKKKYWK